MQGQGGKGARRDKEGHKGKTHWKGGREEILNRDEGTNHVNIQGAFQKKRVDVCLEPSESEQDKMEIRKGQQRCGQVEREEHNRAQPQGLASHGRHPQ